MEIILADRVFCNKFFLCEEIENKNEISTNFFYNVYKNHSNIILEDAIEWYRFYTVAPDLVDENCFRLYINCKNQYLQLFLDDLLQLCLAESFNITQFKVTTYKYDNKLPRDTDADDRTQQQPSIIVYLTKDESSYTIFRDYMLAKYSVNTEEYKASNINIGTKRLNINDLFYWSNTTTTKTSKKYLLYKINKYKQKYHQLKLLNNIN